MQGRGPFGNLLTKNKIRMLGKCKKVDQSMMIVVIRETLLKNKIPRPSINSWYMVSSLLEKNVSHVYYKKISHGSGLLCTIGTCPADQRMEPIIAEARRAGPGWANAAHSSASANLFFLQ